MCFLKWKWKWTRNVRVFTFWQSASSIPFYLDFSQVKVKVDMQCVFSSKSESDQEKEKCLPIDNLPALPPPPWLFSSVSESGRSTCFLKWKWKLTRKGKVFTYWQSASSVPSSMTFSHVKVKVDVQCVFFSSKSESEDSISFLK